MRLFTGKRRGFFYFAPFLLIGGFYFVTQLFPLTYHIVHLPVDDAIPFVPAFVVPYLIWYLYVPLPLVYMFFTDQDLLRRQALALFPGMFASLLFFLLFPTQIDFRPAAQGAGVFRALCRLIYRFDRPVNVLPRRFPFISPPFAAVSAESIRRSAPHPPCWCCSSACPPCSSSSIPPSISSPGARWP